MKNASKGGKKYPTARSLALCVFAGYIFLTILTTTLVEVAQYRYTHLQVRRCME